MHPVFFWLKPYVSGAIPVTYRIGVGNIDMKTDRKSHGAYRTINQLQ